MPPRSDADLKVWDPLVRLVHWSMVACVSAAWLVSEGRIHDAAGYLLLVLIAVRILWGFSGPRYARFANFVGPRHRFSDIQDKSMQVASPAILATILSAAG
jgi:cytochrome b